MATSRQSYRRQDRSLRMTFRFDGGDIELAERRAVDAVAPPSQDLGRGPDTRQSGFWVELQDAEGHAVYRRVMRNPIRVAAEVPVGEGGFTNAVSVAEDGMFSLLVPNLPQAREMVLFASPLDRPHVPEPAREVARAPLRAGGPEQPDGPGQRPDPGKPGGRDGRTAG